MIRLTILLNTAKNMKNDGEEIYQRDETAIVQRGILYSALRLGKLRDAKSRLNIEHRCKSGPIHSRNTRQIDKIINRSISAHMGSFPQDGENEQNLS